MPKISVIIPAYNAESTIRETIESVREQTFTDWEIIVVNDGSLDKTVSIVEQINEPRLKLVSYENGGVALARNRGITHAKGEFITFLDADDLWSQDKLELQLQTLIDNPKAKVAYSWTNFIDSDGEFLFPGMALYHQGNIYRYLLEKNFILSGSNLLINRDVLDIVKGFTAEFSPAADWDFYLRLARHFKFAVVPQYQIFYRQSSSSMSSQVEKMKVECLVVLKKAFQAAPKELQFLKNKSHSILYFYCADIYFQQSSLDNRDNLSFARRNLQTSLLLYPRNFLSINTQRLLIKLILRELSYSPIARFLLGLWHKFMSKDSNANATVIESFETKVKIKN